MEWLVVAAIAMVVLGSSLLCLFALMGRSRMQRLHRVDPATPTDAPISWLIDPRNPARLHRRLARVGTATTTVADDHRPATRRFRKPAPPSPIGVAAEDLRAQAVALDLQLARVAMLAAGARRQPLADLSLAIGEAESATTRLVAMSAHARAPRGLDTDDSVLGDVTGRIDRLAQAHQDLLDLDADNRIVGQPVGSPPLTTRRSPVDPAAMDTTGRPAASSGTGAAETVAGQTEPQPSPSPASH